jgi:FkbM family methyltransferase
MGIGKFVINTFGMKHSYQVYFEKLIRLGAMGLGYEQPMKSTALEQKFIKDVFANMTNKDVMIFDVGANKGDYIEMVVNEMSLDGFSGEIHAFEPAQENCAILKKRYTENHIHINSIGLGLKDEELTFFKHKQDDISSFYEGKNSTYRDSEIEEQVVMKLVSLDEYCEKNKIDHIDLLKIDTEGHEFFVLKGGERMLENGKINAIQFEFSDMNIASRTSFYDFWELLSPNYSIYRLCKDSHFQI